MDEHREWEEEVCAEVGTDAHSWHMVELALDGAEFVIREELRRERPDRVLELMPDIVFLVARRVADWDLALKLAERTAALIACT